MAHFLVGFGEFERNQLELLDDVCRIVGARVNCSSDSLHF